MISSIIETNEELTKHVIMSFNANEMPITELVLQKVIFQIKMDLGKGHPLYENLPYYWYYYGPFSETLRNSFNASKRFLKPSGEGFMIKDNHANEFKTNISNDYVEIEDTISNLISKGDYVYYSLTEDIYKNFAPFDMIYNFKYGIFNPTEKAIFKGNATDYIDLFQLCIFDLSKFTYFNDFTRIFSKFSFQFLLLNEDDFICENWDGLRKPIRKLWFAFANGLRCQAHDSYYDGKFKQWDGIFQKNLVSLNNEIDNFIRQTDSLIKYSDCEELDDDAKNFLNSIGNAYWGYD